MQEKSIKQTAQDIQSKELEIFELFKQLPDWKKHQILIKLQAKL